MRRRPLFLISLLLGLLLVVALIGAAARAAAPAPLADGPVRVTSVDTSAYPQVALYVAARDAGGALRADLGRSDFQIVEDGAPVQLTDFVGAGGTAISTALVVDSSGSMDEADKIDGARAAAAAFVDMLRPGDQAAIIDFNSRVHVAEPFTASADRLHAAIDRLQPDGGTALYDGVAAGVDLLKDQPGRRVLLVLTDGQDCRESNDCPDQYGSSRSLDQAIAYASAAGQAVYLVGLGQRGGGSDAGIDEAVLRQIASGTGGEYFYSPAAADLAGLYTSLAGSLQREYRLTYTSPRPFYDGTRRDIQVTVGGDSAGGGYTEAHLINVSSSPLVGAALLLPLLGLLLLPGLIARRRAGQPAPAPLAEPSSGTPPIAAAPVALPDGGMACRHCGAPLRPGARFCGRCGGTQPAPPQAVERRSFCDMCGLPLLANAQFCSSCGEPVLRRPAPQEIHP
jgi:Ca-activated chloride channel family protein